VILKRLQRLLCLSLEGQPAAELIEGTALAWQSALGHIGPERLDKAFDNVEKTAQRWPSPRFILDNLPAYFVPTPTCREPTVPLLESDGKKEEIAASAKRTSDHIQKLRDFLGIDATES